MKFPNWITPKTEKEQSRQESFNVRPIGRQNLPPAIEEEFDDNFFLSGVGWPELANVGVIEHKDGSKTYIADWGTLQQSSEPTTQSEYATRHTFIADMVDGKFAGFADLRFHSAVPNTAEAGEEILRTPFVGNVFTEEEFKKKGLGERRYMIMNQLSLEKYGMPLSAGHSTSPEATALWEKLVSQGYARRINESKDAAFEFFTKKKA